MNRRTVLKGGIVLAAAAHTPLAIAETSAVAAVTVDDFLSKATASERYEYHLAELKRAAEEIDPAIGSWHIVKGDDPELGCGLIITAHRVTGRYEGDGTYEAGSANWNGNRTKYRVKLLDYRIDGHRMFKVDTSMDSLVLAEPRFNTFIGRRLA